MRKNCNICQLDVSTVKGAAHRGPCPVCQKETKHVIAVPGLPWVCSRIHPNDETHCAVCQVELIEDNSGGFFLIREGLVKNTCIKCSPHGGN